MVNLERFAEIGNIIWYITKLLIPGLLIIIAIFATAAFIKTATRVTLDLKVIMKSPWFILLFVIITIAVLVAWYSMLDLFNL